MDFSQKYIKMCQKAEEIQEHHLTEGDIARVGSGIGVKTVSSADFVRDTFNVSEGNTSRWVSCNARIPDRDKWVWLSRQDQLQEILLDGKTLPWLIDGFFVFCKDGRFDPNSISGAVQTDSHYAEGFTSMEQLLLAFLMHERYQKRWDGYSWVKESHDEPETCRNSPAFPRNNKT